MLLLSQLGPRKGALRNPALAQVPPEKPSGEDVGKQYSLFSKLAVSTQNFKYNNEQEFVALL